MEIGVCGGASLGQARDLGQTRLQGVYGATLAETPKVGYVDLKVATSSSPAGLLVEG